MRPFLFENLGLSRAALCASSGSPQRPVQFGFGRIRPCQARIARNPPHPGFRNGRRGTLRGGLAKRRLPGLLPEIRIDPTFQVGWYTVRISEWTGAVQSAVIFNLRYGRYNSGNANCDPPASAFLLEDAFSENQTKDFQ